MMPEMHGAKAVLEPNKSHHEEGKADDDDGLQEALPVVFPELADLQEAYRDGHDEDKSPAEEDPEVVEEVFRDWCCHSRSHPFRKGDFLEGSTRLLSPLFLGLSGSWGLPRLDEDTVICSFVGWPEDISIPDRHAIREIDGNISAIGGPYPCLAPCRIIPVHRDIQNLASRSTGHTVEDVHAHSTPG